MKRTLTLASMVALLIAPIISSPAKACSCGLPADIAAWVGESEAAFVGTLIEKRDAGPGNAVEDGSIYVFEVETWVKGDAGDVIEVLSASDGAACGFEFWNPDNRTGAILYEEDGRLHGGLCSQVEPDVLLAAMAGPELSSTRIPALLVAKGWDTTGIDVLDANGGYITTLHPPENSEGFTGTQTFASCPGGKLAIQQTDQALHVWDLQTLEVTQSHSWPHDPNTSWILSASCDDEMATSIRALVSFEESQVIIDLTSGEELTSIRGFIDSYGTTHVVYQPIEGDQMALIYNMETGESRPVIDVPPGEPRSVYAMIHPHDQIMAVVDVLYSDEANSPVSTLSIINLDGSLDSQFEIPHEAGRPVWVDETRVIVGTSDWNGDPTQYSLLIDTASGEVTRLDGFHMWSLASDGSIAVGAVGGEILRADLETGEVESLTVLPTQQAGPLVILPIHEDPMEIEVQNEPPVTTPPLVLEPDVVIPEADNARLIALMVLGIATVGLGWLGWTAFQAGTSGQSDEIE